MRLAAHAANTKSIATTQGAHENEKEKRILSVGLAQQQMVAKTQKSWWWLVSGATERKKETRVLNIIGSRGKARENTVDAYP